MMPVAVYPGCSLTGSSREYMESLRAVLDFLNIPIKEIEDWNCCGATAAHSIDHSLSVALPSRILNQAAKGGCNELLVPCAACYNRLKVVQKEINSSPEVKTKVAQILDVELNTPERILNILDYLLTHVITSLEGTTLQPFTKKVACYYGCLLVRPKNISDETRIEDPQEMDNIMHRIGAVPIQWAFKTECCGAGFSVSNTQSVARLSSDIITDAVDRGAKAIIVACPMCHSNLDMRRKEIEKYSKRKFDIPVLFITQAIGLALGIPAKKLGLQRHFVPVNLKS
ncbi:MAG TPA: CoB--CoM heterodisulfide reductase iron-sulfur subunit B family protein [Bacteroidales bacterium]|nr:CoB--CoM heterodisulfide reductase iron-sulfur subunit B family protein [Bacteroidales bacterium]